MSVNYSKRDTLYCGKHEIKGEVLNIRLFVRKNAKFGVSFRGKTIKRPDDGQGMLFNLNFKFKRGKLEIATVILIPEFGSLYMDSVKNG